MPYMTTLNFLSLSKELLEESLPGGMARTVVSDEETAALLLGRDGCGLLVTIPVGLCREDWRLVWLGLTGSWEEEHLVEHLIFCSSLLNDEIDSLRPCNDFFT